VLIFCLSVRMLDIIEKSVIRKGYKYNRLDGTTSERDRQVGAEG
jgi:SNF2 family DNA or RNA helicase